MATVKTSVLTALALAGLGGCDDLQGFGGDVPPLATIHVTATGDLAPLLPEGEIAPRSLQVALVYGTQWLPEPLCILPPENDEVAAALAAGCRDPFGFVPDRVGGDVPIAIDEPTTLTLDALPAADVLVGDVTARVAYASLVLYDDRDGDGTLRLGRARRLQGQGDMPPEGGDDEFQLNDIVYASSFLSMTEPDQRVSYREGAFSEASAFYPRHGCGAPPPGFGIVAAGGFTAQEAIAATLQGRLPDEDPATCSEATDDDGAITLVVRDPREVSAAQCTERRTDSSVRYREPPVDAPPDLDQRTTACAHLPTFDGTQSDTVELVISGRPDDSCRGLSHYVLRGCRSDPSCEQPDWDLTANPPDWWPCE